MVNPLRTHRETQSKNWQGPSWYRFLPPAGKNLPTSTPEHHNCGSELTGWMNGDYPSTVGETIDISICFEGFYKTCFKVINGKVTHCGEYFVYFLNDVPACPYRYCAN